MVTALPPAVARRPPLKWAGGKRWQLPHLEQFWTRNQHRRLVEPFCGGLAVVLGLSPKHALLNDINPHLVNFYRWLKRGLVPRLDMRNRESAFYENRDRFNALIAAGQSDTREAAELFYYLNRTCYNGLCRFNSEGPVQRSFWSLRTHQLRGGLSRVSGRLLRLGIHKPGLRRPRSRPLRPGVRRPAV